MAACIFILVNILFALKYLERYTEYFIILSFVLLSAYIAIITCRDRLSQIKFNYGPLLILLYVALAVIIFSKIDVNSLNVDRWSVISSFWDTYFNGDYAYMAKSFDGNYPGPMPFYFILALPFYYIGELGYFSLLGLLLFWGIYIYEKQEKSTRNYGILLLTASLFFLWEIACRSNLFTNAALVLFGILYLLNKPNDGWKWIVIQGVLTGLFISTRNIFAIPYIIAYMYLLLNRQVTIRSLFITGAISLVVLCATFLPFVIGHWSSFGEMNPFIIQGNVLMPLPYTLLFLIVAFACSFLCKSKADVIFYSGIVLFLTVLFYFSYHVITDGIVNSYYGSAVDISYFIFCTPFLIYKLSTTVQNI